VQTNHARLADLTLPQARSLGADLLARLNAKAPDKGSCMIVLATDIPLTDRQLRRVLKRCPVGMIRLGSFIGHGSGEIIIGFSTGNIMDQHPENDLVPMTAINEQKIDRVFRAAAEATEEAVLDSMLTAETVVGFEGHKKDSLYAILKQEGLL